MPNDTFKSSSDEARAFEYLYNPQTGEWEPVTAQSDFSGDTSLSTTVPNSGSVTTDSSSKVDSQAAADKEYIEIEYNTLEGELNLKASKKTIAIKAGHTIRIEGLGKYLSGLYYVSAVKRTLDSSQGYSHTLTVIKTGFGSSLKQVTNENTNSSDRPTEITTETDSLSTFEKGDKVMFRTVEANKYVYTNANLGEYVPKWVTKLVLTVDGISSDGKRVRLKEIWSWTYASYLKKA